MFGQDYICEHRLVQVSKDGRVWYEIESRAMRFGVLKLIPGFLNPWERSGHGSADMTDLEEMTAWLNRLREYEKQKAPLRRKPLSL